MTLKTRLCAKPFLWKNEFYLQENKICFHIRGFLLSLALKQRLEATLKWSITLEVARRI